MTINRKLRLAFNNVLARYKIDDLQLEIDLVSATREALGTDLIDPDAVTRQGTFAALQSHEERAQGSVDVSMYPADVADVVRHICTLWQLTPPRLKKSLSGWIECVHSLQDACGQQDPIAVIDAVRADYLMRMAEKNGTPPYIVSGPCSLINMCRALSGQIKERISNDNRRDSSNDSSSFYF